MKRIQRKLESLVYMIGQAFVGIFRNGALSFASVAVLIACLLITGSFFLIITNINHNISDMEYLNQIVIYINKDCPDDEVDSIFNRVGQLENVKSHYLVTKEEALAEEKEKHPENFLSLKDGDNPYRDSIVITYMDGEKVGQLEEQLKSFPDVDNVISRVDVAVAIDQVKSTLYILGFGFFSALVIVTVFIIITTVKVSLYSRRHEISLMWSIGATKRFIVLPFIIEGFILGVAAALLAFFAQGWIYSSIEQLITRDYSNLFSVIPYFELSGIVIIGYLAIGVLTGILGSCISIGRHVNGHAHS